MPRTLHASLIGINAYQRNELNGCIKDVLGIDFLLRDWSSQQIEDPLHYDPLYLLAPNETDELRIDAYEKEQGVRLVHELPTFKNVSEKAFSHLKKATKGDVCLLYYSGHGSQVDAPEEFWASKSDRKNETLVCLDSRTNPDARDLIDKEIAWLLWDALHDEQGNEKDVHCVLIMDCCHSGNNTRGDLGNDAIRYRHAPAAKNKVPLEQYLGFDNGFYTVDHGKAEIKIARYVHLAAARDAEKAQESNIDGGMFTSKLLEVLRAGGTGKNYRNLVQNLSVTVRNRVEQQNPVAYSREDNDLDKHFLGDGLEPYQASFEVRYDAVLGQWKMYGGTIHGLVPSGTTGKTLVKITDIDTELEVVEVFSAIALLGGAGLSELDPQREDYRAIVTRLASKKLRVGLSPGILRSSTILEGLKTAWLSESHLYFDLDFESVKGADYIIQLTSDDHLVLTKPSSHTPLFKREANLESFLRNVDSVGKWINTSELKNSSTGFSEKDFIFRVEKIEGQAISANNIEHLSGTVINTLPEELLLFYQNEQQPAFRLSIQIHPDSSLESCFVGALYLTSKFGIDHTLIQSDESKLVKGGSPVELKFPSGGRIFKTIPVKLDEKYTALNINEITAYAKLFVSNIVIDLQRFRQPDLELDTTMLNENMRGDLGFERGDSVDDGTDWAVFTTRLRIIGKHKEKTLKSGEIADFTAFKLEVPPGFLAKAFAATGDDQQHKLKQAKMRGLDEESDLLSANIQPPAHIWGDVLTENSPFASGMSSNSDNGIQVLELLPEKEGDAYPVLMAGQEILLEPVKMPFSTRSIDGEELEEIVIPYGFDQESQLYFPLGYTDAEGRIHIQQLPPPSDGRIQGDAPLTRSIGGSIKLYFKKIFRKKNINTLALYLIQPDGNWAKQSGDAISIKTHLQNRADKKALLLIHGLKGDTRHIVEALKDMAGLKEVAECVLTYDYENLATPIEKTAGKLQQDLKNVGFGGAGMPELVVVAHSLGGLVSRWMVEQLEGRHFVKHLIIVASSSAGSEMGTLGSATFSMLTHAINVTGPIKYAITGLSFLLKKMELDAGHTLKQLQPGSKFIQELAMSCPPAEVRYSVIGGDTALLKDYQGDDYFLKKVGYALKKGIVYPGLTLTLFKEESNDMAVTLKSMRSIQGFDAEKQMIVVASDHLAYFRERRCQEELLGLINREMV